MPAPSDSFIVDYVRAEGSVSRTALDLALSRRNSARKTQAAKTQALALDLVAENVLPLEAYLRALAAHEQRSAPCPACGALRYVRRRKASDPCPQCSDPRAPSKDEATVSPDSLTFESYVIASELGRGAMGVVYDAVNRPADRREALKILLPRGRGTDDRVARFHRERELLARVKHPAVVAIHRAGEHGGLEFLSMELVVNGRTLRAVQEKSPRLSVPGACALMVEVARGVGAAHEVGVLHRDLKPENVIVGEDGHAHVVDFGLARTVEGSIAITHSGALVGTPLYMALEMLHGSRDLDARTDVYALAIMLHELLAGEHAHDDAETLHALVQRVKSNATPRLRAKRPEVPEALDLVLARALSADRAARPAHGNAFADAIEGALAARPRRRGPRLGLRIAAVVAVVGTLAFALRPGARVANDAPDAAILGIEQVARDAIETARAREAATGSGVDLEAAARSFEEAVRASDGARAELDAIRCDLIVERVRAAALDPKDGALDAALTLLDRLAAERARALKLAARTDLPAALACERAVLLVDLGHLEEGSAALTRLRDVPGPGRDGVRFELARTLRRLGRRDEALAELAHIGSVTAAVALERLALDPRADVPPEARLAPAAISLARARTLARDAALVALTPLAAAHPGDPAIRIALGETLLALGLADAAAEVLEASAELARDPLDLAAARTAACEAWLALGKLPATEQRAKSALTLLERPLPGPGDPIERRRLARGLRARALVALGDVQAIGNDREGARNRYEAAGRADPSATTPLVRQGDLALARGDGRRAHAAAERALAAGRDLGALDLLAEATLADAHAEPGLEAVLARVEAAVAAAGDEPPEVRADLLLARARLIARSGTAPAAIQRRVAELDRLDPFVRSVRAATSVALKETSSERALDASLCARARLVARPRSAALAASLADASVAAGVLPLAAEMAVLAVELNPESSEARLARGSALAFRTQLKDAMGDYRIAFERGGPRSETGVTLGCTALKLELVAEAIAGLDATIEWAPFNAASYGWRASALDLAGRHAEADADRARESSFTVAPDALAVVALESARAREIGDPQGAARTYDELLERRPGQSEALLHRGIVGLAFEPRPLAVARMARAVDADPGLEQAFVLALETLGLSKDRPLALALAAGIEGRDDLEAESAYAAGMLELLTARETPDDHAARALLLLDRAVSVRPLFHAARLERGLAKSLVFAPASGVDDARLAFAMGQGFAASGVAASGRALLAVVLARHGDAAEAERELAAGLDAVSGNGSKPRAELRFLPPAFRDRDAVRSRLTR